MALKAEGLDALEERLNQALDSNAPALIEVPCGNMPSPWDFNTAAESQIVAGRLN